MATKDRGLAQQKRAYMKATGKSLRQAQRDAATNAEPWKAFTQNLASCGARARLSTEGPGKGTAGAFSIIPPGKPTVTVEGLWELDESLPAPERMVKAHLVMWQHHYNAWRAEMGEGGSPELALSHAAATMKAREAYEKAKTKLEQAQAAARHVVPMTEFQVLRRGFLIPLAKMLKNIPAEIAALVNPDNPTFARERAEHWLVDKLQPQIVATIHAASQYDLTAAAMPESAAA